MKNAVSSRVVRKWGERNAEEYKKFGNISAIVEARLNIYLLT